jgi:hypothetical protein
MDLPVWQGLYESLKDTSFLPITIALDTRGPEAARPWIEAARPAYPSLIDETHLVADLYGMVNVPIGTWIDEEGIIVRPPETAGTHDAFRAMSRTDFSIPADKLQTLQSTRQGYLAALRDWAHNGARSRFALSPEEVRRRLAPVPREHALAATHFRLGEYLWTQGDGAAARRHHDEAIRLHADNWAYKRQAWNLEDPLKSGGPEFWAAVDALGDREYYVSVPDIPAAAV